MTPLLHDTRALLGQRSIASLLAWDLPYEAGYIDPSAGKFLSSP